jgi:hypothetical protein
MRINKGLGAMPYLLLFYQIALCRDWLSCMLYRLRGDMPLLGRLDAIIRLAPAGR